MSEIVRSGELIRIGGWYRAVKGGLEPVTDEEAERQTAAGEGFDLVKIEINTEEIPLW
jgi:hypothetical protein